MPEFQICKATLWARIVRGLPRRKRTLQKQAYAEIYGENTVFFSKRRKNSSLCSHRAAACLSFAACFGSYNQLLLAHFLLLRGGISHNLLPRCAHLTLRHKQTSRWNHELEWEMQDHKEWFHENQTASRTKACLISVLKYWSDKWYLVFASSVFVCRLVGIL